MSKNELQQEIVKKTEELPEFLVKEILDFAEFLLNKQSKTTSKQYLKSELEMLSGSEGSHLEEEFLDYRNIYPKVNA